MLSSLRLCLNSLKKPRKLCFLNICKSWKKRESKEFSSDLSCQTSSFATTEVSQQLKQVFKFIDTNGDGKISSLELSEVLLRLGQYTRSSLASKEAESIVREMDCDGDGFVDFDEFMNVMGTTTTTTTTYAQNNEGGAKSFILDQEDELFQAFLIFDADKNGVISAEELQRVLISLGCHQNCSLGDCRRMIKGVDKDGDGFVNFQEFKSMMSTGILQMH
ncbi:OLC1v1038940C1 [Oldenlandia corymbosa var. corymbosa]|uniref:OLC1v1038940C1 n=1 Tax=Oldenlandia corymbosa var. corymbosa TaxID=529605 RepID=A0AAV1D0Y5_OLDCO|nr:OLC1v1038940C1 [Oldenlandia corymbosa var. corymbosa]